MHGAARKIYICHQYHEHDRTYTENLTEYLVGQGTPCESITINSHGYRPELESCLDDHAIAVIGYNEQLDHSWLKTGSFLEVAVKRGVPVLQWILDHPSSRWSDFCNSTAENSRFLLNSDHEARFFEEYCLPGSLTARMGGVGPNHRSRIEMLTRQQFMCRPYLCLVPLSLHRLWSLEENEKHLLGLEEPLGDVARAAIASARWDLVGSPQSHITAALVGHHQSVPPRTFNLLCRLVEHAVQGARRLKIFSVAREYAVLIQSDQSAAPFVERAAASFASNVGMHLTLTRMPRCRAVLSVSPANELIHDRTLNALNAGSVAIAEDNLGSKGLLQHKVNALLFNYEDESLAECLDIVCYEPERAYEIALAGMRLRDDPRVRFTHFHNIFDLAERPLAMSSDQSAT